MPFWQIGDYNQFINKNLIKNFVILINKILNENNKNNIKR